MDPEKTEESASRTPMPPLNKAMIAGGTTNAKRLHLRSRRLLHPQNVSKCPMICCLVVEPAIPKKCQGLLGIITCLGKSWVTLKKPSVSRSWSSLIPQKQCVYGQRQSPQKKMCVVIHGVLKWGYPIFIIHFYRISSMNHPAIGVPP